MANEKPLFIKLEDKRIKLKNIKDYGIGRTESETATFSIDYCKYVKEKGFIFDSTILKKCGKTTVEIPICGNPTILFPKGSEEYFWKNVEINYRDKIYVCKVFDGHGLQGYIAFMYRQDFETFVSKCTRLPSDEYSRKVVLNPFLDGFDPFEVGLDPVKDLKPLENKMNYGYVKGSEMCEYKLKGREKKITEYLYITTYQNDNYRFYQDEVDFDIREKLNLLDSYLSG